MRRIAVVGGGIAGLAAALRLQDLAQERGTRLQLALYEAQPRMGGCIHTRRQNGFLLEAGADSLLIDKPWGARLLERLGLSNELVPIRSEYRGARILHRGRLRPIPSGFRLFSPRSLGALLGSGLLSPAGLLRAAAEPFIPARSSNDDESLASFVTRRFGGEVLDRLAQPLVGGIYSADPQRLSMAATLPQFLAFERDSGSVMRGLRANPAGTHAPQLMSLRDGLESIVTAIGARLRSVERIHERVGSLRALLARHDGIVLAVPAYAGAAIVRECDPRLAQLLESIRYNSIAAINLGYDRSGVPDLPRMQGFVVPAAEQRRIVAATIASQKYPGRAPDRAVLLRAFSGGALDPNATERSDAELVSGARAEFAAILGIRANPRLASVDRNVRLLPEYGVGHVRLVAEIEERAASVGNLTLAGSAYHGVGIPDCVHSGEAAAERLLGII